MAGYSVDGKVFTYRKKLTYDSSAQSLGGSVTDVTIKAKISASDTDFWANDDGDGTYVRFTDSVGTVLSFWPIHYDVASDNIAVWDVKVTATATDFDLYIYYGDEGTPSDGSDRTGSYDSNFVLVNPYNTNASIGIYGDATSNAHTGTGSGTPVPPDAAGSMDRAISLDGVDQHVAITDAADLSFGNGTTPQPFTIEAVVNMTDASGFRICSKGTSTSDNEYGLTTTASDLLTLIIHGSAGGFAHTLAAQSTATFTADEGTWIRVAASYNAGSSYTDITLYKGSTSLATTDTSAGTYNAPNNFSQPLLIGKWYTALWATGSIEEFTLSDVERSADWHKVRDASRQGTWLTVGTQETGPAPPTTTAWTPQTQINVRTRGRSW